MQPGTKILIAEDNPNSARLIFDYLTAKGAQLTWEKDGSETLKRVKRSHYDLLVLDLRLPGKNGFVVAQEIRNNEHLFDLPIIVTSAFPDEQNLLRSYQLGVDLFLSKPVDLKKLYWQAKNLTSRKRNLKNRTLAALVHLNELSEKKLGRAGHATAVKNNCLALAAACKLEKHLSSLETAALLHDLGLIFTGSNSGHGAVGAEIVRRFGIGEEVAFLIEKHSEKIPPVMLINPEETLANYRDILKLAEIIEESYRDSLAAFHRDKEKGVFTPAIASVIARLIETG